MDSVSQFTRSEPVAIILLYLKIGFFDLIGISHFNYGIGYTFNMFWKRSRSAKRTPNEVGRDSQRCACCDKFTDWYLWYMVKNVLLNSIFLLILGVGMISIFSLA